MSTLWSSITKIAWETTGGDDTAIWFSMTQSILTTCHT